MVAITRQETVITTASQLVNYDKNRTSLAINNLGSGTIYFGFDSQLTTSNGFPIVSGQSVSFSKQSGDNPKLAMYFIAASNQTIAITEQRMKKEGE